MFQTVHSTETDPACRASRWGAVLSASPPSFDPFLHFERRESRRLAYHETPTLRFDVPYGPDGRGPTTQVWFQVWGRDLSQCGMAFLTRREVLACIAAGDPPTAGGAAGPSRAETRRAAAEPRAADLLLPESAALIRLDGLLRRGNRVTVGLQCLEGGMLWTPGQIVRVRAVDDELFECGVTFRRPVNVEQPRRWSDAP